MRSKLAVSLFLALSIIIPAFTVRTQDSISLDDLKDFLKENPCLELSGLWEKLETDPGQRSLLRLEQGSWDFELIETGSGSPDSKLPAYKVLRLYDNKRNNWLIFFVLSAQDWIYSDSIEILNQETKNPSVKIFPFEPDRSLIAVDSFGKCGQSRDADIITFYGSSDLGLKPVLTVLKNGYVRGGETMSDRNYVLTGYSSPKEKVLELTWSVEYYGDVFGYSYDQRWTEEGQKMLLNTVEKKALFVRDQISDRFVYDAETSTLAEEDREALVCQ